MNCQFCEEDATQHVTEMVDGHPVEYHVCDEHFQEIDPVKQLTQQKIPRNPLGPF